MERLDLELMLNSIHVEKLQNNRRVNYNIKIDPHINLFPGQIFGAEIYDNFTGLMSFKIMIKGSKKKNENGITK